MKKWLKKIKYLGFDDYWWLTLHLAILLILVAILYSVTIGEM